MLNQDYRDILSLFADGGVEHLVVGAYALAVHGLPRATGDIDLWVNNSSANSQKVIEALRKFGAPVGDLPEDYFCAADHVLQLGVEPARIDILAGIDGVIFSEAWSKRVTATIDGLMVPILAKSDLLRNKLASSRDKDLGDIAWLKQHQQL